MATLAAGGGYDILVYTLARFIFVYTSYEYFNNLDIIIQLVQLTMNHIHIIYYWYLHEAGFNEVRAFTANENCQDNTYTYKHLIYM